MQSKAAANAVQGDQGPSQAASLTRKYHPHGADFRGMMDVRVKGSWGLAPSFQKATDARQQVIGQTLREGPERARGLRGHGIKL